MFAVLGKLVLYYFRPCLKYGNKIFLSNGLWLTFFPPDVCQLHSRQHRQFCSSEREIIFPPDCSKFAVEYDWNSKNSQNFLEK